MVHLDRVSADEVAAEGRASSASSTNHTAAYPQTEQYLGSTVVILRAP